MSKILIIDDDDIVCKTMSDLLKNQGYDVSHVSTIKEGVSAAQTGEFDLVFLDVQLPDGNGLEHLPEIQSVPSAPEVIVITGYAEPEGAEFSIKSNAWDYIAKPFTADSINLAVSRSLQYRKEKNDSNPAVTLKTEGIIGKSRQIQHCLDLVARAARCSANILVAGETGTGKELFARAIHKNSSRADRNFVVVDCTSLPDTLIESLLFGHTKGAYTGAVQAEEGFIKHADGGTLFLDEIGELPLATQKSFLRVLQERQFTPVGGASEIESNFRLVAATNRNLKEMVAAETFREDLYFRLSSIIIDLPPLRERAEDIKDLALNYVSFLCESQGMGLKGFSPEFFDVLSVYSWPGNVRELYGVLEYVIAQAFFEQTIFPKHLPESVRLEVTRSSFWREREQTGTPKPVNAAFDTLPKWREYRKSLICEGEKKYMRKLMTQAGGNIKRAAALSDLSCPRIYELLRKYDIAN
jgi:two-component system NtrC family response regulator